MGERFLRFLKWSFFITFFFVGVEIFVGSRPAPVAARFTVVAAPAITLNVPDTAFIGQQVNFTVTFDNTDTVTGYGPIIDLIIPTNGADGNQNTDTPDGLTFVDATYLGVSVERTVRTFPGSGGTTCVDHPYIVDSTGAPVQVCGNAGDTFVSLRLPFGSFTPDQPPVTVEVTVDMSNLADLGVPLTIQARGGYQFGETPLDDWCCGDDPSTTLSPWVSDSVTPNLVILSKTYSGSEDETATGPNFPRQYTVTAEIAPGQTVDNFTLTDTLPDNMQFVSVVNTNPAGATCTTPSTSTPGGTLSCNFGTVSGTVSMTFEYYIPLRDAGSLPVIDPTTGDDALSCNNATASGSWTPIDTRDATTAFTEDPPGCEHTLTDKSIAIQKTVTLVQDNGAPGYSPGDVLEYTLTFQVSDFFAFQNVVIQDVVSDGQRVDATFTPTLQVNGNGYTLAAAAMAAANYDVACDYTGAPGPECTIDNTAAPNTGTTTLTFRVSDELVTRGQDGRLIGGCVPPGGTGGGDPDCNAYNDGPTTGTITFRTVVQQTFSDDYPSGDPSVDQGDTLTDDVTITGDLLQVSDASTPTGQNEADTSAASVQIPRGALTKSIYAVNGSTSFTTPVEVKPGDTVTYRLTYTLTTGDVENLRFEDFLPLPVLSVDDPDADGVSGPAWTFDPTVSAAIPAPGVAKFGPSDTFYTYSGITPSVTSDAANNRLTFTYGSFDGPNEGVYTIDLLFTVTVSAEPFADRLYLTNEAYAFEGSTNAGTSEAQDIVQIILTEPVLVTSKGVIWTSNANGVFSPDPPGPVTFLGPASAPRWSGTINSTGLASNPIDSDLIGVDAGDIVSFAILIENQGTSLNGAFDIQIRDTLPEGFQIPTTAPGLNLQIYYGDGTGPISYTSLATPADCTGTWPGDPCGPDGTAGTADDLFGAGIELVDPVGQGVCQAHDPNSGNNVIVITYDLETTTGIAPGDYVNTAFLLNYAGTEGGPNHLAAPLTDDATVSIQTGLAKALAGTELANAANGSDQVVPGELVNYTVTLTIPEGQVPNAQVTDTLDAGLAFVRCLSITPSSPDVTTDLPGGFAAACANPTVGAGGQTVTFDLGTLTNSSTDNSTDETLTIQYQAVALNVADNQSGTRLGNRVAFSMDDSTGRTTLGTAAAPKVTVIEPAITTTKSVTPTAADAGDTVSFTITLSNPGTGSTTAYDVVWQDTVPSGLTYVPGTLSGSCTTNPITVDDAAAPTLSATVTQLDPGETCTLTFDATVDYSVAPGQALTNTATTTWTSLSGDVTTPRSSYNTGAVERTGADGVGGALNDYASQAQATVTVNSTVPQKYLVATSEAHTGDPGTGTERVAIGEIVRYRLVVQIPEGTSTNFQIRDLLPVGLTFLNDGTAYAFFVSDGGISSTGVGIVPGITDSDCQVTGNTADATTPALPAGCTPLADANVGSDASTTTDPDAFATGTDVYFKLGDLTNNDSDPDGEFVVVEFNVLVDNHAGTGANDAGDNRVNAFQVLIGGSVNTTSNNVTVRVAEPLLTLTKTLTTAPTDAGDTVTYTLTIRAASGNDRATAFDLSLTDTFDPYLTGLTVSSVTTTQGATCTGNGGGTTAFSHNGGVFSGNTLTFTATCLDPGQSITLTVTGTLANNTPAGYTLANTADLTWTSLPGTGTSPNPTGSTTPGGSGTVDGERDGSGGVNDYTATDTVSVNLTAPTLTKSVSPTSYTIGDLVTFNLLVTLPEGVTPSMELVDDLPPGLAYVSHQVITTAAASGGLLSADFNGTFTTSPPGFTCTGTCGSGDDITLSFGDATVPADNDPANNAFLVQVTARVLNEPGNRNGVTLTNTATLYWNSRANSASASATVDIVEPALTLTKAADQTAPGYGQTVTYTLTVAHDAASTAEAFDLVVTDTIPAGLTYVPGSITAPAGWTADDSAAPTLTWTCSGGCSLPLVNTAALSYQVTVDNPPSLSPGDTLTNTANLTWTSLDGADPNERTGADGVGGALNDYAAQATATVTITAPDLTITKDDGVTQYVPGTSVTYTIVVQNVGNGDVTGAVVSDPKPPQITSWEWTCAAAGGATCSGSGGPTTLDFSDTVDMPAGSSITYTVTANIASSATKDLVNTVTVTPPAGVTDPTPGNNTATDTDTANPQVDLMVTKDDGLTIIAAGTTLTYTITVTNNGPSDAFGATVSDAIPPEIVQWTWTCTAAGGATCSGSGGPLSTDFTDTVDVPVGGTVTYTVTAEVRETATGSLTNTVSVSPSSGVTETNPADNTATDTDVLAVSDKGMTGTNQTFTPDPQVAIGEMVTYEVTLTVPPGSMTNLTLTDVLDRGMAFVRCEGITASSPDLTSSAGAWDAICAAATVTAEPPGDPEPVNQGRRVVWDFGTLTNGGTVEATLTVRYTVVVLDSLGNQSGVTLQNRAVWTWDGGSLTAQAPAVTVVEPDLTLTKEAEPLVVLPDEPVTLTLTVRHTAASETPAYDVVLVDPLPDTLEFVSGTLTVSGVTPASATYDPATRTVRVVWDVLPLGETARVQFQVRLRTVPGDRVTNTANVAWSSLPGDVTTPQSAYNVLSTERFYDPGSPVDVYGVSASVEIRAELPATGFAPGRVTVLPPMPEDLRYQQTDLVLEIPKLGLRAPIVGVPRTEQGWDLSWLMGNAGWLEGTTFPTWQGNTGITAHVTLPTGLPGPFAQLHTLQWGDEVRIHYLNQVYVYQVRALRYVEPHEIQVLKATSYPTLTLITCADWDPARETYLRRLVVQAVLVEVRTP